MTESFFDKVRHCRSETSLKMKLQYRCFLVNFCKICKKTVFAQHQRMTAFDDSNINSRESEIRTRNC